MLISVNFILPQMFESVLLFVEKMLQRVMYSVLCRIPALQGAETNNPLQSVSQRLVMNHINEKQEILP